MSSKQKTVIIGAGGHSKVIIDILRTDPMIEIAGCLDRSGKGEIMNVPVLGDDSMLPLLHDQGIRHAFVAIGDNNTRGRIARHVEQIGFTLINAISPHAYVAPSARLGSGIAVMPGAVINAEAYIHDLAVINTGATIDHETMIGRYCHVAPGSNLSGNVHVMEGTFLGTGTKVIDGILIGAWSILGAGSVAIRDLPARCLAVGVPARVIKQLREPFDS
ncbi:acetyltransferase [Paenibacillus alvei]|uniref:Acetyltransferase n=1 Tax=Paenibacillus alvei TaxID=44250 RepID=A0AAP6ZYC8_PAEAL|nr:acetyltransferase [Paenibacillus alvei]MBG9736824.1 hexapeptide transferase [Paenibacillus alvei]MBG9746980.1 hexapeptide transferase [Paenibacillus alvei]MCY9582008.1 acetyltransferase [Paenibacillus alvei]MCY9585906.1 acetyltransferase [Paenibacillus alvei]NOJ70362.1 acetyltransferase [Paenibacillus alvei]